MDIHQKVSISIFGALLLGTMAMFSTGSLSSSALNTANLDNTTDPCTEKFVEDYSDSYTSDKAKIIELQQFVGRNCRGEIVESKKSYCEARTKQIETYTNLVEKYEQCVDPATTSKMAQ